LFYVGGQKRCPRLHKKKLKERPGPHMIKVCSLKKRRKGTGKKQKRKVSGFFKIGKETTETCKRVQIWRNKEGEKSAGGNPVGGDKGMWKQVRENSMKFVNPSLGIGGPRKRKTQKKGKRVGRGTQYRKDHQVVPPGDAKKRKTTGKEGNRKKELFTSHDAQKELGGGQITRRRR